MKIVSVERETRHYYLTVDKNPNGPGLLAIISLGSPQRGDKEVSVCDVEICKNMKAARKWYDRRMATKPWLPKISDATFVAEVPKQLGPVTGLRVKGGKLLADTESGTPMIVPIDKAVR